MKEIDLCWAPVRTLKDAMNDPYTLSRGMILTDATGEKHLGVPIRFKEEPGHASLRLPAYGEHSDELAAKAGASAEQIAAMKARGAL